MLITSQISAQLSDSNLVYVQSDFTQANSNSATAKFQFYFILRAHFRNILKPILAGASFHWFAALKVIAVRTGYSLVMAELFSCSEEKVHVLSTAQDAVGLELN